MSEPILTVTCTDRKKGEVTHEIRPFVYTKENILRLYECAKEYPVLFGRRLQSIEDFTSHLITLNLSGDAEPRGLIWIIDDYRGMFYLNDISDIEASVHYTFFDRRHHGREVLVREMLRYVFRKYRFVRLNAYIPAYAGFGVRSFAERCGFKLEGRKRNSAWWKDKWYAVHLFGILPSDIGE